MRSTDRLSARIPMTKLPPQPILTPRTPVRQPTLAERAAMHPLDDRDNFFHGVGLNAPLLRKLWQTGIMSQNEARRRGLSLTKNFYGGYNGQEKISVSRFMGDRFSFGTYSAGKFSFIIDRLGLDAQHYVYGGFSDEYHVQAFIPPANMRGLLVPRRQLDAPIGGLMIGLTGGPAANLAGNTQAYLAGVCQATGQDPGPSAAGSVSDAVRQYRALPLQEKVGPQGRATETTVEQALAAFTARAYSRKLGKEEPTLREVLVDTAPKDLRLVEI